MLDDTNSAGGGKPSVAAIISKATAKAQKPATPKFEIRMGTVAICNFVVGGNAQACILFLALLELWLNTKRKISRPYGEGARDYLFLSLAQLVELTGLEPDPLRKRVIPRLCERGFFEFGKGRVTRDGVNMYQIHFDELAFWTELVGLADPTKMVSEKIGGVEIVSQNIDRDALPALFKRLYDRTIGAD